MQPHHTLNNIYITSFNKGDRILVQFDITGMSCAACGNRVEKAVTQLKGVESCSVNLLTNSMSVTGDISTDEIIRAVTKAGYGAKVRSTSPEKDTDEIKKIRSNSRKTARRLVFSLILLLPLMYISMLSSMLGISLPSVLSENPLLVAFLQLILSLSVIVINRNFFIKGTRGALSGSPNMDTLVSLGSAVSFLYSVYIFILMLGSDIHAQHTYLHGLYFESAAMILTLITVGKMLEARSKGKTTDAISQLLELTPKTATLLIDGKEVSVSADSIKIGNIFISKAGESIPTDAIIVEGNASLDESALTGESLPADKTVGDAVFCATKITSGYIKCRATAIGEDTTLSKIIKMVSDASATKAPISKIADRVSGVFVPLVIAISIITLISWLILGSEFGYALARAISVLVISCPCALGLATPVAIMVGSGKGAKEGILFKTSTSLEITGKVKTVALDKTGTLTYGTPEISDIIPLNNATKEELICAAYSIEDKSEHPLARAIVSYAKANLVPKHEVTNIKTMSGCGITAEMDNSTVVGGNATLVSKFAEISDSVTDLIHRLSSEGKTPLLFSKGDSLLGIIAVTDTVKPSAKDAIACLHKMKIKTVMLTGDNERTAKAVADKVGVDRVIASLLPEGKEKAVKELSQHGRVLMVGDGINDAPALTAADIGMAIGAGTQIAIDSADVVLTRSDPTDIVAAIKLSRHTLKNIKENLVWAFIYNVIGIPLAAGVFVNSLGWELDPMFGAAAMSLSSFCVVSNALRLNLVKLRKNEHTIYDGSYIYTVKIKGMMCGHCEQRVKTAINTLNTANVITVSHKKNLAVFSSEEVLLDEVIKDSIEKQGYKVKNIKRKLK